MRKLGSEQAYIFQTQDFKNRDKSALNVAVCFSSEAESQLGPLGVLWVPLGIFSQLCLFKRAALFLQGR